MSRKVEVRARRTPCYSDEVPREVTVKLAIERNALVVEGGPTGWESLTMDTVVDMLEDETPGAVWIACTGTRGRWDRLEIPIAEMRRAMGEIFDLRHPAVAVTSESRPSASIMYAACTPRRGRSRRFRW